MRRSARNMVNPSPVIARDHASRVDGADADAVPRRDAIRVAATPPS